MNNGRNETYVQNSEEIYEFVNTVSKYELTLMSEEEE